ncbi:hypothetical protein ABFA07_006650 [Porites harrisoni]
MNSKTTFLLFTVILAVVLCQRIDAFTAGAGNIKKRDYNQFQAARHLARICEVTKQICQLESKRPARKAVLEDVFEKESVAQRGGE